MLLVADSGSSKTDWMLSMPDNTSLEIHSAGINPYFLNEKDMVRILHQAKDFDAYADDVSEIYFFGAGCSSPDKRELVSNALSERFKNAYISVESDLLGSAYATCGNHKGFSCVLGTGSNISFFNGESVAENKHGLGFILGDEGSGTFFGKKIITDFFYQKMPKNIDAIFKRKYNLTKEIVIKHVYQKPAANIYLASFARFMSVLQPNDPYRKSLLEFGFQKYVTSNIMSFENYREFKCHFVGSIAYHFQDELRAVCKQHDVGVGKILNKPILELFNFIKTREKF